MNTLCNNTVHRTTKVEPINVTSDSYAEYNGDSSENILNLKLLILSEYQNTTTFLLKDILKTGLETFLLLAKLKIQFHGLMLLEI